MLKKKISNHMAEIIDVGFVLVSMITKTLM
jgi:hypothetical protein